MEKLEAIKLPPEDGMGKDKSRVIEGAKVREILVVRCRSPGLGIGCDLIKI